MGSSICCTASNLSACCSDKCLHSWKLFPGLSPGIQSSYSGTQKLCLPHFCMWSSTVCMCVSMYCMFMRPINICGYVRSYLSMHRLQLFLQVASCLFILLLLLQQGVLVHLQLADLASQVQLLARFLLTQLLHTRPQPEKSQVKEKQSN